MQISECHWVYGSSHGAIAPREIRLNLCTQNCHPDFGASTLDQICRATWMHVAGWVTSCPCMIMSSKEIVNLSLPFRETWSTHEHQQNFLQYIPVGTPSLQRKLVCETFVCIHFIFCTFLDVTYHVNRQKQWKRSPEKFCSLCKAPTISTWCQWT